MLPHLNERQRRLYLASEAKALGEGGVRIVAAATGCSEPTVYKGLQELKDGTVMKERVRKKGGGRKKIEDTSPGIVQDIEKLVSPETRGDPESPLRWTTKSTQNLANALQAQGYSIQAPTVGRILKDMGYSLQANCKTKEGKEHPDRDAQFVFINNAVTGYHAAGIPTVSVDCKKKELIGDFKNNGQEWMPKGQPEKVLTHDFPIPGQGKGIPYGIYDTLRNEGFVNVGNDHETSVFAVESLRRWWNTEGKVHYPDATELAVICDGGGSNGSRRRQWKTELAQFATETGLKIHVHHLPPGTSKWN